MSTQYPVVVYGASGYTGRLVMEHLRDMGVAFVAAGRNRKRIEEACAIVPGIENARYIIEETDGSVESLTKLFVGRKVVCNTVGPFMRYGPPVVEAALRAGVHYLDTTGEQHWVMRLQREYDEAFAKAGLVLAPSTACMYGVSEIAARYCLETPGVDSIDLVSIAIHAGRPHGSFGADHPRCGALFLVPPQGQRTRPLSRHRDVRCYHALRPCSQGFAMGRHFDPSVDGP